MNAETMLRGYVGKVIERTEYKDGNAYLWFACGSVLILPCPPEV